MSFASLPPRISAALALGLMAGCATVPPPAPPPAISAETNAANFDARSFQSEGLRRFLAENAGSSLPPEADFETLSWVGFYFHPSLELARAQWATARAVERSVSVRPNPTLTLTPGYNFTRVPGVSPWMPGINLDFLFPTAGKRGQQQAIARRDAEAARLAMVSTVWQLRSELRRSLAETASASRREALLHAQIEVQQKLLALLEQRFAAGGATAPDVSLQRTALLRAESAAAEAAGQSGAARTRVAAALGLPLSALDKVSLPLAPSGFSMAPAALAAARRESLQSRADVLAALAKYHAAQSALELEIAKRTPDLHLGPGYQWDQGSNKWTLGFSFELPLFHRNEAPIAEALARRAEAAAQFNLTQSQALAAIDSAVAAQGAAAAQLTRAKQLRAEIEKQSTRVQQQLELGNADQVQVQTARLDLLTVETAVADAENAATVAAGQLEDALQIPFPQLAALVDSAPANPRTP